MGISVKTVSGSCSSLRNDDHVLILIKMTGVMLDAALNGMWWVYRFITAGCNVKMLFLVTLFVRKILHASVCNYFSVIYNGYDCWRCIS